MTVLEALRQGFRFAYRNRPAVWVLFLVNLALAALAALPIYSDVLRFTGHTLLGKEFVFSLDWLTDFNVSNPTANDRFASVITAFALLAIPVNSVLAGGVLAQLRQTEPEFSLAYFGRGISRFAGRLLRLMGLALVCYWVVLRLINQGLGGVARKWTEAWPSERAAFGIELAVWALVLAGLVFVNLVVDYARVRLVRDESFSAIEAFLASLGFCLRQPGRALLVYALPSLAGLALLGAYRLLVPWGHINAPLTVALLFILQQIVMFGRYWFRVATWASEWAYYSPTR